MAGEFGTFDIGNVITNVDAIKTARFRSQLEQNALADEERRRADEDKLRAARGRALQGDQAAIDEIGVIDPGEALQFRRYFEGLDEQRRATEIAEARDQLETMGRVAAYVKSQPDPAAAWGEVYANLPDEMREGVPETFSPGFVDMALARVMSMEDLLDQVEGRQAQDRFDSALGGALVGSESGGNFGARNDEMGAGGQRGHFGRGQFGVARLNDAKNAGVIPASMSAEQFLRDPDAQMRVEEWHRQDVLAEAVRNGTANLIGSEIMGIPVTEQGLVNVAHLGGKDGARRFFESGGKYNPADANGTRLSDYLALGAQESGGGPAQPQGPRIDPRVAALMQAAGDPSLDQTQRDILLQAAALLQPKAESLADRYRNVEGQGLVDLAAEGGPARVQFDETGERPENFEGEATLRKEFTALKPVQEFQVQANAMQRVASAAATPSAAGDLALVFAYMKLLDPGSVVRETEFANAQNATGVPDRIRNLWNRLLNGERLNPDQRADFLGQAQEIYSGAQAQYQSIVDQYRSNAQAQGLDPARTIPEFGFAGEMPAPPAPPAPGAPDGAAAAAPGGGGTTQSGVRWQVVMPPTGGVTGPGSQ